MIHDDIDDELAFHLESRVRDLMAEGLSRDAAVARAAREFGDRDSVGRQCHGIRQAAARDRGRREYWDGWRHDLRYAVRALVRSPLFTIGAVAILTLGIGLSSTVFAVLHGVFLNPLPYPHARELHRVYATQAEKDDFESPMSAGDFFALREALAPALTIGGYMNWPVSLTGVPEPERLNGALVSADLFSTLGVPAIEGRTFTLDDEDPARNVAIISSRLAARLGLTGEAAGAAIELGRQPVTVVGVMPPAFRFPERATDVWIPLALRPADRDNHASRWLHTLARVPPPAAAGAGERLRTVMARLAADHPASNAGWSARMVPLHDVVVGRAGATLRVLALAIACVLLVMIVNLVTLITSRLHRRRTEWSVQQALGADRFRLMRQLAAECVVIAAVGGALGLLMAAGLAGLFHRVAATSIPRADEVAVSPWLVGFAIGASLLGFAAMTLLPFLKAATTPATGLISSTRGIATAPRPSRALVVVQAALTSLLLIAAGLLAQTYVRLTRVTLGFEPDRVLTLRISLPSRTPPPEQRAFFTAALGAVTAVPGVVSAGGASDLPLSGNSPSVPIAVADTAASASDGQELRAAFRVVTPGYLETLVTPVRGRTFDGRDDEGRPLVAMVNEDFARQHWPGREAIGRRVRTSADLDWRTVVGVVANVQHGGLTEHEGPTIYVPHSQKAEAWLTWMSLAIRSNAAPETLAAAVRAALAGVDPNQPVADVRTLEHLVARALALPRLAATIASVAASASLALAALGIGAVLSLLVAARTPDFAVRLALGASPARLAWVPVFESVAMVVMGGAIGAGIAALLTQLLGSMIYGVSPIDAATFAGSLGMLALVAAICAIAPARAIARIDPALTLRG